MKFITGAKFSCILLGLALCGCSFFGKEPLNIDGQRINVLAEDASLRPDYNEGKIKIKLPAPYENHKWSQNGGNSMHLMGHLKASDKLKEYWDTNFGDGSSKRNYLIASPIIAYGVVFAMDSEGIVTARRLDDGKQIWKRRLKPQHKEEKNASIKGAGLAEFNKKIYATTGFGGVFCIDMLDGNIIWKKYLDMPIRIAPTVSAGRVLVQSFDNTFYALDAENGDELWKNITDHETTTLVGGASPAYDPKMDVIVAAFSNGELRAFKASTGTPLWADMLVSHKRTNSLSTIDTIKANPVIDGDKVFAVGYNSMLTAIDLRTGNRIWEKEMGSTNQPWVSGNYLFVLTNNFDLLAINKHNGKIIWNTAIPRGNETDDKNGVFASGPILTDNRLLVATSNGYVFAVSPYTGKIISYITTDEGVELSPIVADATAIFTTNDADMLAYK
ncbi:MAG: hypothetical protein E7012_04330 [Alphaproteobacteria bacterium]|nr:hypothetical protein [Alphaproteobacteria bacterium]